MSSAVKNILKPEVNVGYLASEAHGEDRISLAECKVRLGYKFWFVVECELC